MLIADHFVCILFVLSIKKNRKIMYIDHYFDGIHSGACLKPHHIFIKHKYIGLRLANIIKKKNLQLFWFHDFQCECGGIRSIRVRKIKCMKKFGSRQTDTLGSAHTRKMVIVENYTFLTFQTVKLVLHRLQSVWWIFSPFYFWHTNICVRF